MEELSCSWTCRGETPFMSDTGERSSEWVQASAAWTPTNVYD
ncbi:MAG: hypothetical protein OXG82_21805 [Gammaproteobacteria bacterium]|nr:hypothetical protein [Gammaproteobacteria bacterium]